MINKKSMWFLTLFSLILVLSVYYITMPSELLLGINQDYTTTVNAEPQIIESTLLVALRVDAKESLEKQLADLQIILTDEKSSNQERNDAYDKIKELNNDNTIETEIETLIIEKLKLESFVKISEDQVEVVVKSTDHSTDTANTIIRLVQEKYEQKMYITVRFTT